MYCEKKTILNIYIKPHKKGHTFQGMIEFTKLHREVVLFNVYDIFKCVKKKTERGEE